MKLFDKQLAKMHKKHKTFRLIEREKSILMKVIFYGTLMFLWNKTFMTEYVTTVFSRVYMPKGLFGTAPGYRALRHEDVHIEDCWRWWVIPFIISYVLLLPAGITLRSVWEKRGYRESMKAYYEMNGWLPDRYLDHVEKQFTGSNYFWMWPFKKNMRRWLIETRQEITAEVRAAKST